MSFQNHTATAPERRVDFLHSLPRFCLFRISSVFSFTRFSLYKTTAKESEKYILFVFCSLANRTGSKSTEEVGVKRNVKESRKMVRGWNIWTEREREGKRLLVADLFVYFIVVHSSQVTFMDVSPLLNEHHSFLSKRVCVCV